MLQLALEGWLLGLSTGPYCLGACAPFMVPYLFAEGASWRHNLRVVLEFLLGRFFAYALFGAAVGWLGALLQPHINHKITAAALGLSALFLLLYAGFKILPRWRGCASAPSAKRVKRFPLLLGFLIGINVCPPFLVAVVRLLDVGLWLSGFIFFICFFFGTSLYVLPLVGLSPVTRIERFQRIGLISAVLVSIWYLLVALAAF